LKTKNKTVNAFNKGPIVKTTYDNGAVFLFHEFPGISRVCFSTTFVVGSIQEKQNEYGLAHLLEHLIFKSARNHKVHGNLIEKLEHFGAEINAYTSKDHTSFELLCSYRSFSQILPLFLDLFTEFDLCEEDFNREKKIVVHELKEDENDPDVFAEEKLIEMNFKNEFSHPIGGNSKLIKSFTLTQAKSFYKKWYRANRMIFSLVAGKSYPIVSKEIKSLFVKTKNSRPQLPFRYNLKNKFQTINHYNKIFKKKIQTPQLMLALSSPSLNSDERANLILIDQVLNDGLNSLFFMATRENEALSYGISTSINSFFDKGHYLISLTTAASQIDRSVDVILDTIFNKLPVYLTQEIIENEKRKLYDSWDLNFDDADERLEYILNCELYSRLNNNMNQIEDLISKTTVADLIKFINKMKKFGLSKVIVMPQESKR
jgi:predicted Zn-dependent peptidase